jgi:hypothetical protein
VVERLAQEALELLLETFVLLVVVVLMQVLARAVLEAEAMQVLVLEVF